VPDGWIDRDGLPDGCRRLRDRDEGGGLEAAIGLRLQRRRAPRGTGAVGNNPRVWPPAPADNRV